MRLDRFTIKSQEALNEAQSIAESNKQQQVKPVHLLLALLTQEGGTVGPVLERLGVSLSSITGQLNEAISKVPRVEGGGEGAAYATASFKSILSDAEKKATELKDEFLSTEHILLAMACDKKCEAGKILISNGATGENILKALADVRGVQRVTDQMPEEKYQAISKYTQDLLSLAKAGKLDPVIGRDEEIRRVIQVLSRRTKNNPILIGEAGVGKTAIAEGLALRILAGDVPESLKDKRLLSLDLAALIAGTKYRGEFENRLKALLKEVTSAAGGIVLFIDELHTLVGAGATEGAMDASNMLKPALARGELKCIGATTIDEFRKHIEKDAALARRFQQVYVGEPTVEDTISILRGLKERYEVHHGVRIADSAIVSAANLSNRYISDRFLPDKAIDLIDEAASKLRIEIDSMPTSIDELDRRAFQLEMEREALKKEEDKLSKERLSRIEGELKVLKEESTSLKVRWKTEKEMIDHIRWLKKEVEEAKALALEAERQGNLAEAAELKYGRLVGLQNDLEEGQSHLSELEGTRRMLKEEVDGEDVAEVVSKWTGIPVARMLEGEREKLLRMEDVLRQRVVGQEKVLEVVSNAVRRSRAGLQDSERPVGSFIFLGPTGVGKTETARALAEFLFDDERAMVRLDMSEFMEKHTVARLIGAPPGYVGYEEGGYLTEAVRRRPYSVVLFDEIEKAHPDVFNVLLQILDDGRLTDGQGKTVDFKNTVIIMTSNLGSRHIVMLGEKGFDEIEKTVMEELRDTFKPEFLNRIDDTIIFHPLSKDNMATIVDIQIRRIRKLLDEKKIGLELTKEARQYFAEKGYDPTYGARTLKRLLQRELQDVLAIKILEDEFTEDDTVLVQIKKGEVVFTVTDKAKAGKGKDRKPAVV